MTGRAAGTRARLQQMSFDAESRPPAPAATTTPLLLMPSLLIRQSRRRRAQGRRKGGADAARAADWVVTKKRVRLLDVNGSLTDDLARWLAEAELRPAVVPAPLRGVVHAVATAPPEELSRNDPVSDTAAVRQAAVLILIATDGADGPDVLLQQRASNLRDHAGEVAFPGGARESGDTGPAATALREAAEEIGVDPGGVEPLILLPRLHIPPSRFDVTGVLAHWRTPSPVSAIDPGETNRVMRVPFTALAAPENRIMLSTSFGWPLSTPPRRRRRHNENSARYGAARAC
jgi:8-oxo-dGTP pyrophosphatase MutT (NUDIX family)